jgi:hypothetical protein
MLFVCGAAGGWHCWIYQGDIGKTPISKGPYYHDTARIRETAGHGNGLFNQESRED